MEAVRQIGIRMTVDASSVTTQVPQAARAYDRFAESTEQAASRASRSTTRVSMSIGDLVRSAAGLTIVAGAVRTLADGLMALPQRGFAFTRDLEVSQSGMAGILGSMTAINGQQTTFNQGLTISSEMIRRLNDDALRTAATSQELVTVFQALLAPGLSARMTLEQIRELTVVGTNAVKSMGLEGGQVVQELRDLVAGGITPASSTLATALGLKDSDIAAAKASSEGLFSFLMKRLEGFKTSADSFGQTLKGTFDQFSEGATRVAAEGMVPLTAAIKQAVGDASALMVTFDKAGNVQINPALVESLRGYAEGAVTAVSVGRDVVSSLWEHREAVTALAGAYAAFRLGQWGAEAVTAVRAQLDLAQAARLARVEAAAQAVSNTEVSATSRQKVAALMAELQARQAAAQAEVAATAAQSAQLVATREAIVLSRAEVVAKMEAARATMAQAEAQIQAARAAGAQSFAIAALREGTDMLSAAQARHAALVRELAVLGQQQARVNASIAATTVASATAINAATTATAGLTAAKGAASVAARSFGAVVGALGGPVGIAIAAVTGLAMWLFTLKGAADDAAKAGVQIDRAKRVAAAGGVPEERDIVPLRAQIEALKNQRDELLAKGERKPGYRPSGDVISGDLLGLASRRATVKDLESQIVAKESELAALTKASKQTALANTEVTLTVTGTEQAWKKATDGVKTATAAQEEYKQKLQATRSAFEAHKSMLERTGASPDTIKAAQAEQLEVEAALAKARDQQLKGIAGTGAAVAARAERRDLDAQIESVREGYKLLALSTADGMDVIDSLRKRDLLSEYGAIQLRRDLNLRDLSNREQAVARELSLARQKKDSAKEQEGLQGQLREIGQQRINVRNRSDRDMEEALAAPQLALLNSTRQATEAIHDQASALEDENTVHVQAQEAVAKLTSAEDALNAMRGRSKSALLDLSIAQLERRRADLEATNNVIPGYIEMLDKQIAAEKRLRDATSASEGLDKADEIRKKQLDEARKTSEDIRGVFRQGVVDALDNNDNAFASIGKSLKRTVVTALADAFYDATLKQAVDGLAQTVTQALKGSSGVDAAKGGGSGGGLLGALWSGVSTFLGFGAKAPTPNAKGGAYAAAGLSAYSSTLVDRPTLFPFAKGGIGLMGEAGTEGIFPLKRDSQGRLGVIGSGSGESMSLNFAPVTHFHMDSRVDRGAAMADLGRAMGENNKKQLEGLQRLGVAPR